MVSEYRDRLTGRDSRALAGNGPTPRGVVSVSASSIPDSALTKETSSESYGNGATGSWGRAAASADAFAPVRSRGSSVGPCVNVPATALPEFVSPPELGHADCRDGEGHLPSVNLSGGQRYSEGFPDQGYPWCL